MKSGSIVEGEFIKAKMLQRMLINQQSTSCLFSSFAANKTEMNIADAHVGNYF